MAGAKMSRSVRWVLEMYGSKCLCSFFLPFAGRFLLPTRPLCTLLGGVRARKRTYESLFQDPLMVAFAKLFATWRAPYMSRASKQCSVRFVSRSTRRVLIETSPVIAGPHGTSFARSSATPTVAHRYVDESPRYEVIYLVAHRR